MIAKLWQTVLTAAFQLMTFEYIRRTVLNAGLSCGTGLMCYLPMC